MIEIPFIVFVILAVVIICTNNIGTVVCVFIILNLFYPMVEFKYINATEGKQDQMRISIIRR